MYHCLKNNAKWHEKKEKVKIGQENIKDAYTKYRIEVASVSIVWLKAHKTI